MLEKLLKLYQMYMLQDVRSPLPHLFGPPGVGKSQSAEQLAELVGKKLHIVNVSRLSPLDIEGIEMPGENDKGEAILKMLHSTRWTDIEDGDIMLFDEFLRGFPEVYNGLLEIFTSRRVGSLELPKVFIMAASNSVQSYDAALEDRMLHLPVRDIRKTVIARRDVGQLLCKEMGLMPTMLDHPMMTSLISAQILPLYELLDQISGTKVTASGSSLKGSSPRKLIGQVKFREIQCDELRQLLDSNNALAMSSSLLQYIVLTGKGGTTEPVKAALKDLADSPAQLSKLTPEQRLNLDINLQLIELEEARTTHNSEEEEETIDELFD